MTAPSPPPPPRSAAARPQWRALSALAAIVLGGLVELIFGLAR